MGKPLSQYVEYTDELAREICARRAEGETLTSILRSDGMPTRRAVEKWRKARDDFATAYQEANEDGFDTRAERALESLYAEPGVIIGEDGRTRIDPAWVALIKVRFWGEMEMLKRWDPKRYGDRMALDHGAQESLATLMDQARARVLALRKPKDEEASQE